MYSSVCVVNESLIPSPKIHHTKLKLPNLTENSSGLIPTTDR